MEATSDMVANNLVKNIGFKVFSGAVANGGSVKCITVKNGNNLLSNVRIKPGGDIFSEAQINACRSAFDELE